MKKITKPFQGKFPITQNFGVKVLYMRSGIHNGTDFGMPKGTPLIACFDGEIIECENWNLGGYGKNFKIQAPDGRTIAHYAHCSEILVKNGTKVDRGDMLAKSGNTGFVIAINGGIGNHLHFGILFDKKWIDPMSVVEGFNLGIQTESIEEQKTKIEVKSEDIPKTFVYEVEKGDTLSKIAKQFLGNGNKWKEIFELNKKEIANANKIKIGMKIRIPKK